MTNTTAIDPLDNVLHGRSKAYVQALLLPDNPLTTSPEEKSERAGILADLYDQGYSLRRVGEIAGGLSAQRVQQILAEFGFATRPMYGAKKWREEKKAKEAKDG